MANKASRSPLWEKLRPINGAVNKPNRMNQTASNSIPRFLGRFESLMTTLLLRGGVSVGRFVVVEPVSADGCDNGLKIGEAQRFDDVAIGPAAITF